MLTSNSFEILHTTLFSSFKCYFADRKTEAHFVRKGISVSLHHSQGECMIINRNLENRFTENIPFYPCPPYFI
jgi:hypothetical protein